jgi:hypothetical protein
MIKRFLLIALLGSASSLLAQPPTYKQVLDGLSKAEPAAAISLPSAFFAETETDPRGKLQRGVVLFAAAGRAREQGNRDRAPVLISEAKNYLLSALNGLTSGQAVQRCQAYYTLGQIAEMWDGNLGNAQTYYQQAVNQQTGNAPAQAALARVQRILQGNP